MFDLYISMHSGPVWSTSWVPGQPELHGKTLSLNKQKARRMPGFGPMGMGWLNKRPRSFLSSSSGLAFILDWILPLDLPNCTPMKSANNFWQKGSSFWERAITTQDPRPHLLVERTSVSRLEPNLMAGCLEYKATVNSSLAQVPDP